MSRETLIQPDTETVPLQHAVLCVDCEFVSASRRDECPVCGGRSLLALARMLGGALDTHRVAPPSEGCSTGMAFNLEMKINLKHMDARCFSSAVEGITGVIESKVGHAHASFHIDVEPVVAKGTTRVLQPRAA